MNLRDQYAHGFSLGHDYAAEDRKAHATFAAEDAELRAEATDARADSRSWRAFKLGIARGYRDATRTLERGRWGQ